MLHFSIHQWALWDLSETIELNSHKGVFHGKPALKNIPPMVKRRMPVVAQVIQQLNVELGENHIPCVYASKNGELSRTIKIIRQFGSDLSPALFSMSVHNAIAGLLSVINQDNSPYTVIDSMSGVVEMAVFEAVSMLAHHQKVKVIYFEEPTADEFAPQLSEVDSGMVLMMVLEHGSDLSLQKQDSSHSTYVSNTSNNKVKDCVSLLNGDCDQIINQDSAAQWLWRRH